MRNEDGGRDERVTTNIDAAVLAGLEFVLHATLVLAGRRKWTCHDEELFFVACISVVSFGSIWLWVVLRYLHVLRC